MQSALRGQSPTLLIVGVVAALLVADSSCFPTQLSVQQIIDKDLGTSEATLSMIVNQMAVLKLLNQSSTICSLHERELQERMNRSTDLDTKTEQVKNEMDVKTQQVKNEMEEVKEATLLQVKNEILAAKEAAILELKNITMATMNAMNSTNEDTRIMLDDLKGTGLNASRQVTTMAIPKCESGWSEYQSSCYKVFETGVIPTVATARCRALGAHLATIGSEGENSFVFGLISSFTYIGLDDTAEQGVWAWQDGSLFSYSKWDSGEPSHTTSHCVIIRNDASWHDTSCTNKHHYICEKRLV